MAAHHEDREGLSPEVKDALKKLEIKLKNEGRQPENKISLFATLFSASALIFVITLVFSDHTDISLVWAAVNASTFGLSIICWMLYGFIELFEVNSEHKKLKWFRSKATGNLLWVGYISLALGVVSLLPLITGAGNE